MITQLVLEKLPDEKLTALLSLHRVNGIANRHLFLDPEWTR